MKTPMSVIIAIAVIAACRTTVVAQSTASAAHPASPPAQPTAAAAAAHVVEDRDAAAAVFEKLKSLAGKWRGVGADGRVVDVSYDVVSGGKALLQTLAPADEPTMVTLYHLNGDEIGLTHFCSSGNQPRLRAEVASAEIHDLRFTFLDVTNLATSAEGHIDALTVTFQDGDHLRQTWTWLKDGLTLRTTHDLERL